MKHLLSPALRGLGVLATAAQLGCGSSTEPTGPDNGSLSAKIDGNSWSAQTIVASYNGGLLVIAGTDRDQRTLGFAVGPTTATGTFSIGLTQPTNANLTIVTGGSGQGWIAAQNLGSGSVTITRLSATGAAGTFQFVMAPVAGSGATGNKAITEGRFDVKY